MRKYAKHMENSNMKKKLVVLTIEASSTGFGVYGDDFPVTGYGKTIPEAKQDLIDAMNAVLELHKEEGSKPDPRFNRGNLKFEYKYDLKSIFEHLFALDVTNFARLIGMNPSLLRQYKTGKTAASEKQKKKIEEGIHKLGRQLLEVRL
jgi:hypothetical protein